MLLQNNKNNLIFFKFINIVFLLSSNSHIWQIHPVDQLWSVGGTFDTPTVRPCKWKQFHPQLWLENSDQLSMK